MEKLHTLHYSRDAVDPLRSFVFEGRLMTPQEVTESFICRGEFVPPKLKGNWFLCGDVTAGMFDAVKAKGVAKLALRLSVFTTPQGGVYLVLTHQIGASHHRFVLPVWDADVLAGVKALYSGRLQFMLARQETQEALVISSGFEQDEIEPLLAHRAPEDSDQLLTLLAEMPTVVQTMRQMEAVPGCNWLGPVAEVAVSVIAPVNAALSIVQGSSVRH